MSAAGRQSTPWQPLGQHGSAQPVSAGTRTYVVQPGDSFWSICVRHYGSGRFFRELEQYNLQRWRQIEGDSGWRRILRPGDVVELPDVEVLRLLRVALKSQRGQAATTPEQQRPARPGYYRVRDGDTLSSIAQRQLGSAARWQEIYELNREILPNPNFLRSGLELRLPAARTSERLGNDQFRRR